MKITWIGHSCFKIEKNGFVVVLDPYGDESVPGLSPVREMADLVLCTHEHGDHNYRAGVYLESGKENPFTVETISTYHDEVCGAKRGSNKIYLLDDGTERIVHLGDLGCELSKEQKERLYGVNVLLIPVGGYYTIDAGQAAALAEEICPRAVIPMHFRSDADGFGFAEIGTAEQFTGQVKVREKEIAVLPGSTVDTGNMPDAAVVVLAPANAVAH